MLDLSYMFKDMTERNIKVTNPYSGQSEMLTMYESILYGNIIKATQIVTGKQYVFSIHKCVN